MNSVGTLLLFVGILAVGEACSCMPQTTEEHYQTADVVLRVSVESDLYIPEGSDGYRGIYDIRILSILKGGNYRDISKNESDKLHTATEGNLCGVSLEKDAEYIISGRVNSETGELNTGLCDLIQKVSP